MMRSSKQTQVAVAIRGMPKGIRGLLNSPLKLERSAGQVLGRILLQRCEKVTMNRESSSPRGMHIGGG